MNAQELRLGNWVQPKNAPAMIVKEIKAGGIGLYMPGSDGDSFYFDNDEISPIELTKEILLKCGLKAEYGWGEIYPLPFAVSIKFEENKFWLTQQMPQFDDFGDEKCVQYRDENTMEIKYLHQLQNLYFALTGEELSVTL